MERTNDKIFNVNPASSGALGGLIGHLRSTRTSLQISFVVTGKRKNMTTYSRARLVSALCRKDFLSFAAKCFGHIYPGKGFIRNWHYEAIAYQLMRIIEGKTKNLTINVPPRSLKSFFISVVLPAYLLGIRPSFRIVRASYSQDLSISYAVNFRKIVESDWYKKLFNVAPPIKNTDAEYHTAVGGTRYTTSVGGTLTGRGGDLIIIDDPLNGIEAYSKPAREKVIAWFTGTAGSRLDDKRTGAIIVVMQRLHQDDLTGFLLQQGGWDQLKLPAVAPADLDIEIGWRKAHRRSSSADASAPRAAKRKKGGRRGVVATASLRRPIIRRGPPRDLGVALSDDLRERRVAVDRTITSEGGERGEAWHLPDTSTIHPRSTPKPALRRAALNSAEVICLLNIAALLSRQPLQHAADLHRVPVIVTRRRRHSALVERLGNPFQARYPGRP
jgi:hypothetical protein